MRCLEYLADSGCTNGQATLSVKDRNKEDSSWRKMQLLQISVTLIRDKTVALRNFVDIFHFRPLAFPFNRNVLIRAECLKN